MKNRRSFDLEYSRIFKNPNISASDYVLSVVDMDFFKDVNDNFGHIIGDETLIAISNIMKSFFEKDEFLYRFSGEEFIVLRHDLNMLEAITLLGKLRLEVANFHFPQQVGNKTD